MCYLGYNSVVNYDVGLIVSPECKSGAELEISTVSFSRTILRT